MYPIEKQNEMLILSDNYPPETNANARIIAELVSYWPQEQVSVLTCHPNFPTGKVFEGYPNVWLSTEQVQGIKVTRVKTYLAENKGFFKRSLDFLSFGVMSFCVGLRKHPEVIIGVTPQFFCGLSACLLSWIKKKPFVLILCDLWPDAIVSTGNMKMGLLFHLLKKIEIFMYRQASLIVVLSPHFREYLIKQGIDEQKIHVSISGVDTAFYPKPKNNSLLKQYNLEDRCVAGAIGTMGAAHNHAEILYFSTVIREKSLDHIRFLFIGNGVNKSSLETMIKHDQIDNVIIDGPFPADTIPDYWSLLDIAIILLADIPTNQTVIPSKMIEAMAMGKPVLLYAPKGQAQQFLEDSQAGIFVPAGQIDVFIEKLLTLSTDHSLKEQFSQHGLAFAKQHTREQQATIMLDHIQSLCRTDHDKKTI